VWSPSRLNMKALLTKIRNDARGFSLIELLIVVAMISVVSGFAMINLMRAREAIARTNAAGEFAVYLEKARLDSSRRHATKVEQMAQVKIFNGNFYNITLDADGDGAMDVPQVITLPKEQGLSITGPFPKTYIFDWLGRTVDEDNNIVAPQQVNFSNGSGLSAVRFSETGKPVVVPNAQGDGK